MLAWPWTHSNVFNNVTNNLRANPGLLPLQVFNGIPVWRVSDGSALTQRRSHETRALVSVTITAFITHELSLCHYHRMRSANTNKIMTPVETRHPELPGSVPAALPTAGQANTLCRVKIWERVREDLFPASNIRHNPTSEGRSTLLLQTTEHWPAETIHMLRVQLSAQPALRPRTMAPHPS